MAGANGARSPELPSKSQGRPKKLMSKSGLKSAVRLKRYQSYEGAEGKATFNFLEFKFSAAITQL